MKDRDVPYPARAPRAPREVRLFALLLILALPVFFAFLGTNSVWDTNEAFYVETPRQMVRTGDYVNPSFNGAPRFNKPVLSYWVVAGLYRAFGESVTVERVGIAIGAMAIVLSAFLIGRALRATPTGLLAALVVATAPRVVWFSRKIFIDVYLTTFTSLALAGFVLAQTRPEHRRRYLVLTYGALGLGVLTKGPVAIVVPGFVCLIWLALEGRLADLRRLMVLPGTAIVLAIVAPWYVAVYLQHGWTYIASFLFEENLGRYATTAMTPEGRDVTFYLPVLLSELFPWAPLVVVPLVGIVAAWRREGRRARPATDRLLWLWVVVFVVVFSFSRTKEDLYIFPIVPAVAALVAAALTDSFEKRSRLMDWLFVTVAALCVLLAPALLWIFGPSAGFYALPEVRPFALVLGAAGAVALTLWVGRRPVAAVASLAAGFVVLNYVFVGLVLAGVERTKPVPPLVHTLDARAAPDARLGYFNMGLQSFVYYADRGPVEEIGVPAQAQAFFSDQRESWALMGVEEWNIVRGLVPDVCIADRHPLSLFDAKLPDMIRRVPPEDVLLVKNHCGEETRPREEGRAGLSRRRGAATARAAGAAPRAASRRRPAALEPGRPIA